MDHPWIKSKLGSAIGSGHRAVHLGECGKNNIFTNLTINNNLVRSDDGGA
jgi:hypothetical protein